jgi:hypothetical protein
VNPGWLETIAPDEDRRFAGYAQEMGQLQRDRSVELGVSGRALHRKSHGGVAGTFTVPGDPSGPAVFAQPKTWLVYLRFSNGGSGNDSDAAPGIRGLSLKLVGVDGKKALGDARTQDFLLIHRPVQPFRDPDEFMRFVRLSTTVSMWPLPLRVLWRFGLWRGIGLLRSLAEVTEPIDSLVTAHWWSAAPIRWGETAARYALIPVDPPEPDIPVADGDDTYAADLAARLRQGSIRYDFAVQTWVDEDSTPIEDASVDWDVPYHVVGRIEIPAQELGSPRAEAVSAFVERLSFDPWHAVEELRPVGSMMRARKYAYYASTIGRGASPEPDGTETFPR